jgi:hypothetical protein
VLLRNRQFIQSFGPRAAGVLLGFRVGSPREIAGAASERALAGNLYLTG